MGSADSVEQQKGNDTLRKLTEARDSYRRCLAEIADRAKDGAVQMSDVVRFFTQKVNHAKAVSEYFAKSDFPGGDSTKKAADTLDGDQRWEEALSGINSGKMQTAKEILNEQIGNLRTVVKEDLRAALEEGQTPETVILDRRELAACQAVLKVINDAFDLGDVKGSVQEIVTKAGLPGRAMGLGEALSSWKQQEQNLMNLISAELGNDTVVMIRGSRHTQPVDVAENPESWKVFKNIAIAYKRKGDEKSVRKLLAIFPEHSQLQTQLIEELGKTEVNRDYKGHDPTVTIGEVIEVECGNQYDLLPGAVDFRKYVSARGLDAEALEASLFDWLTSKEIVYAEDSMKVDRTIKNVKRQFGENVGNQVWDTVSKQYLDYQKK